MKNLSCTYLGLTLKNPIVVGSSGLTARLDNLERFEKAGAGAIVLKSIFEEQIHFESNQFIHSNEPAAKAWKDSFDKIVGEQEYYYQEAYNYLTDYAREHTLNQYLELIREAKRRIHIPIIASINCTSNKDWEYFAKKIEEAGADALELNIYILPSDLHKSGQEIELLYQDIISRVKGYLRIPLAVKIGYYFSNLAKTVVDLSASGIQGLTLFNRPYNPDLDIEKMQVIASHIFSSPEEYTNTLRWIALLSGKVHCDLAAASGIHDGETAVKQLLAGASAVQMVSVFYKSPFETIQDVLKFIEEWMERHGFETIDQFKGILSQSRVENPAAFERVQFIRLYSSIE